MITKFLLNTILHHVGMSWIICSNNEMFYATEKIDHTDWFNTGPWYNTAICPELHGKRFEDFIIHEKQTDIISCVL